MSADVYQRSDAAGDAPKPPQPTIVDLGRQSRKRIDRLLQGRGKLLRDVHEVMDVLKAQGKIKADAETVIILVRERAAEDLDDWLSRCPF